MTAPLYVDVSPLLNEPQGDAATFVRRLVPELAREVPVRLIASDVPALSGRDIPLSAAELLRGGWADRLLTLPSEPHNPGRSRQCAALFPHRRPNTRHFRREVGVLHGFDPLVNPDRYDEPMRRAFAASARALRLCDAVVAVSDAVRHEAELLTELPPDRVTVCPPGSGLPDPPDAEVSREGFILIVTAADPGPSGVTVRDWLRTLEPQTRVVWVGPTAWPAALGPSLGGRVAFVGRPADTELCRLLRTAALLVCPEATGGFPFPVLDALRRGCPVAAGYAGPLTEFDGFGVSYFDPGDADTLAAAVGELRSPERPALDRAALERRFAWRGLAQAVLKLTHGGALACAS